MNIIKNFILIIFLIGGFFASSFAQANSDVKYTILPQSKLYIDGTSTFHNFTINAKEIRGYMLISKTGESSDLKTINDNLSGMKVVIPVKKLDTDKSSMNNNMDKALKADKAPDITYVLDSIESGNLSNSPDDTSKFITKGTLSIAGVNKVIEMPVDGSFSKDGKLHFKGEETIKMTDFGVEPPTMLFGTIRTGDQVVVHFNFVLAKTDN